jgi:hypothetical protein
MNLTSIFQRQCGECKACCTAIGVQELGKPFNRACKHECDKGCDIYGKHPDSCQGYQCGWLSGCGEFQDRPDKIGAVFHPSMGDDGKKGSLWITVFLTSDNSNLERIEAMTREMLSIPEVIGVRYVKHNQVMNAEFPINLKDYPGGGNVGSGTSWLVYGNDKVMFLDAPCRHPLPVIS